MALTTRRRALATLGAALAGGMALPAPAQAGERGRRHPRPRPLRQAHAHNDYEHPRPLLDALDHRFTSVEADIHLVDGQLLVAHDPEDLDPGRTLESLYLKPLAARVRANHGSVYRGYQHTPFQLLVDIKTEGAATYAELHRHLLPYRRLFTSYTYGKVRRGAVTAVVSGDRAARAPMTAQKVRYAFYDGRLADLGTPAPASLIPLISDNWSLNFGWQGVGPIPPCRARQAARHRLRRPRARAARPLLGHARPAGPPARRGLGRTARRGRRPPQDR